MKIRFNIILPRTPTYYKQYYPSFSLANETLRISYIPYACYRPIYHLVISDTLIEFLLSHVSVNFLLNVDEAIKIKR
jgi:hypothetical protein